MHRYFFFVLLLFLPTQLGYHVWPEWAHVLGRRIDYLSPTIFLTDIFLVLTVGSWMIEKFPIFNLQFTIKRKNFQTRTVLLWMLSTSLVVANIFFAASPLVAVFKWIKVLEFFLLGYYIIQTKPSLSFVTSALSVAALYSSLIAVGQFVLQRSIGGPLWLLGERTFDVLTPGIARVQFGRELLRAYGTFPHPNVLGGFLAAMMPLIIYKLTNLQINKLTREKIFYGVTLLLGVIALALTFGRSAMVVGTFGATIVIATLYGFRIKSGMTKKVVKKTTRIFVSVGITAALCAILFLLRPFSSSDESVVVRQQLNMAAIKQWWSSPVFGVGLGNFLVHLPSTLPSHAIYFLQPVHNIFLLLLSELGAVGVIGVVWVFWGFWKKAKINFMLFPIHYSLFAILLLGLVDHYPLTLQQGQLMLTVFFALSLAL